MQRGSHRRHGIRPRENGTGSSRGDRICASLGLCQPAVSLGACSQTGKHRVGLGEGEGVGLGEGEGEREGVGRRRGDNSGRTRLEHLLPEPLNIPPKCHFITIRGRQLQCQAKRHYPALAEEGFPLWIRRAKLQWQHLASTSTRQLCRTQSKRSALRSPPLSLALALSHTPTEGQTTRCIVNVCRCPHWGPFIDSEFQAAFLNHVFSRSRC